MRSLTWLIESARSRSLALTMTWVILLLAVSAGGQEDPAGADRDWRFIQKLRGDGMHDVAAQQLTNFARAYPDDPRAPEALLQAGVTWQELEQGAAAIEAYDQLLRRFPSNAVAPQALLRKGDLLSEAHAYQEAANVYRGLLSSYPASDEVDRARLGLGEALLALDQPREASRLFHFLLAGQAEPKLAARALFDLGVLHQRAGSDSLAIAQFDAVEKRFPGEILGAFGLLRAAELLTEQESSAAARVRYERVLDRYEEPFLKARAHLGLATLEEEAAEFRRAAKHYEAVAEHGGTEEQLERALLGLASVELAAKRGKQAQEAADAYLARFPEAPGVSRARLLRARAGLLEGNEDAPDSLRGLSASPDRAVAFEAMESLADWATERGNAGAALSAWREAERVAPSAASRATALRAQARIQADDGRHAYAAELALEAENLAEEEELRAGLALLAMQQLARAGDLQRAVEVGQELVGEHPTRPEATQARHELRRIQLRLQEDPTRATHELASLALRDELDAADRALAVGRVLRDVLGDPEAALESFGRARSAASNPEQMARAGVESGLAQEAWAQRLAAAGQRERAKEALAAASAAYADAAAQAGAEGAAQAARMGLLRRELAAAAQPDAPWAFDAGFSPLLGGVGAVETVNLEGHGFDGVRRRLEGAVEKSDRRDDRAWILWRQAELAAGATLETRVEMMEEGIALEPSPGQALALRYGLGQLYLMAEDRDRAARELRRVLEDAPESELGVAARYSLAEAHRAAKRYPQAGSMYAEFAGAYPATQKGQRALLLAGDCALFAGDPESAVGFYRQLLERHPESIYADDAQYRLGTSLERLGKNQGARESFLALSEWDGDTDYRGRGLLKLARLEQATSRDSLAAVAYERLREVDPELAASADAELELAVIQLDRGDPRSALRWLDRRDDERDVVARSLALRTRAQAALGKFDDAEEALDRLSRGFPDDGEMETLARLDLAEALDEAGRTEDALAHFERAATGARSAELQGRAHYGAGLTLSKAGRFPDALPQFEEAVARAPGTAWEAEALFKIAGLAAHAGDDKRARDAYARIFRDHPRHPLAPEALRGEALAWRRMENFDRALQSYHALLENFPDAPGGEEVLSNIAYCHHELGQFEVAIRAYERVLPLLDEEGQAYAQFWIADSLERLSRYEEAAAAFLRVPYLYPTMGQLPVTAQLKAAGVYERMGQTDAAVRLYEKVVAQHGKDSQWGNEAEKRLSRITEERGGDS